MILYILQAEIQCLANIYIIHRVMMLYVLKPTKQPTNLTNQPTNKLLGEEVLEKMSIGEINTLSGKTD